MARPRSPTGLDRRQLLTAAGLGAGVSMTSAKAATPEVRVAAPRVDYLENPLGLDNAKPRFSWTLEAGAARDVRQTAYRVSVAGSPEALRPADRCSGTAARSPRIVRSTSPMKAPP
jgi:alpha-L-rhamnosidase